MSPSATPHDTPVISDMAHIAAAPAGRDRLTRALDSGRVAFFEFQHDGAATTLGCSGTLRWMGACFGISGLDTASRLERLLDAVVAEDRRIIENVLGIGAPGRNASGEFRVLGKHGQVLYLYGEAYTDLAASGGPAIVFGTIQDVTNQRRYEADLTEIVGRNRMLLAVIEACPISVTVADVSASGMPLTYANRAFCQMTGYEPDEVLGHNCQFLQGPQTEARVLAQISEALRHGRPAEVRLTNYRKDGSTFLNQLLLAPIHGPGGELAAYFGLQSDVTLEAKHRAAEQQRQKIEVLGRMMGGVAHEINNLLQPIMLLGQEILDEGLARDAGISHMELLLDCGKRASQIIGDLLAFSRPDARRTETVDGGTLLTDSLRLLRQAVPPTLYLDLRLASPSPSLAVDRTAFTQILLNLVGNASAAMEGRGDLIIALDRVLASLNTEPDRRAERWCARLRVLDSGHGMDSATLDRVFEPFFTTKPVGQGTGLGLSVVYGLVSEMGGRIMLDSVPRQGTTVTVLFPIRDGIIDHVVNPDH